MLRHAFDSPKLAHLGRLLPLGPWPELPEPFVVGTLEKLWHFTATQAPRGDIGRWGDAQIGASIRWPGDAATLIAALVEARLVDRCLKHKLIVHDWHEHADQTVQRCQKVKRDGFAALDHDHSKCTDAFLASVTHVNIPNPPQQTSETLVDCRQVETRDSRVTGEPEPEPASRASLLPPEPEPEEPRENPEIEPNAAALAPGAEAPASVSGGLSKPAKRRREPSPEPAESPGSVWIDGHRARGHDYKPDKGEFAALQRKATAVGLDRFKAALSVFLASDDMGAKRSGYSVFEFCKGFQRWDAAAQQRKHAAEVIAQRELELEQKGPPVTAQDIGRVWAESEGRP